MTGVDNFEIYDIILWKQLTIFPEKNLNNFFFFGFVTGYWENLFFAGFYVPRMKWGFFIFLIIKKFLFKVFALLFKVLLFHKSW